MVRAVRDMALFAFLLDGVVCFWGCHVLTNLCIGALSLPAISCISIRSVTRIYHSDDRSQLALGQKWIFGIFAAERSC